jgi:hypothetical protein
MQPTSEVICKMLPIDEEVIMTRIDVAEALSRAGYPFSPHTLSTKATRGGGPPYSLFARRALYRWGDALAWARSAKARPRSGAARFRV